MTRLRLIQVLMCALLLSVAIVPMANAADLEDGEYLYLRCSATNWDVNDENRMVETEVDGIYAITMSVDEAWLLQGYDQCLLTLTDGLNSWGTMQRYFGSDASEVVAVPGSLEISEGDQNYFQLDYPALGEFTVLVDMINMTLSIDVGEPAPVDAYYYLRCNTTGWGVNADNRFVLNADSGKLELGVSVTQNWIVNGNDMCIVTETDQEDGWGTGQTYYGTEYWAPLTVPVDGTDSATLVEAGYYFGVDYPALGDYTATFDPATGELVIGTIIEDEVDWGLNGAVEDLGDGQVRVTYDFETDVQLLDWAPVDTELSDATIEDGRLILSELVTGLAVSQLARGIRVDSISYEAEILEGIHVNVYFGIDNWANFWAPDNGYGLIHRWDGQLVSDQGAVTQVSEVHAELGVPYTGSVIADPTEIIWTVNGDEISYATDYASNVGRNILIGSWDSTVAFDNIVIEGELEPLD